ncbi:TPA: hypothetical protein EYP37_03375 [Candidatus Poribacteria bacterium]|nr:hypothetical protein [Candidatus Poribacteria bacterium]
MVEFDLLPERIKEIILKMLSPGEGVRMCFMAKGSLSKDFIVITDKRVFIVDERRMGGWVYANVKGDIPIADITEIEMKRGVVDRLLGQSSLSLKLEGYEYLIDKAPSGEAKKAFELITSIMEAGGQDQHSRGQV